MCDINLPTQNKEGIVTCNYKGGKIGPGGTDVPQTYVKLSKTGDEAVLKYDVYFDKDFDFCRGGKLPGLASDKAISGGSKATDDFSVRLMWRRGGDGEAYLYVPSALQTDEYKKKCTECNDQYGDSVGRGSFKFQRGEWNKIELRLKLNQPGKHNGVLQLSHNGKKEIDWDFVTFRRKADVKIAYMMFSTFFGGSTQEWAPSKSQTSKFKNFTVNVK